MEHPSPRRDRPSPVEVAVAAVLTWWFVAGLAAWLLVGGLGRAAQVAVVVLGWFGGVVHVVRRHDAHAGAVAEQGPVTPSPGRPTLRVVRDVPARSSERQALGADARHAVPADADAPGEAAELDELERRAAALRQLLDPGVEAIILVAHRAALQDVRRTEVGVDLDLDAHRASYVLKTGDGDVVRTNTAGQQVMRVLLPRRLLDAPEGERFLEQVHAWSEAEVLIDVEWEVSVTGTILYVLARHEDHEVQLGTLG